MTRYQIEADITFDLNMEIEASSPEEAERFFRAGISVTAGMAGRPETVFDVWDESITCVQNLTITKDPNA